MSCCCVYDFVFVMPQQFLHVRSYISKIGLPDKLLLFFYPRTFHTKYRILIHIPLYSRTSDNTAVPLHNVYIPTTALFPCPTSLSVSILNKIAKTSPTVIMKFWFRYRDHYIWEGSSFIRIRFAVCYQAQFSGIPFLFVLVLVLSL